MTKTNKKAVALLIVISIFICLCASACKGGNSPAAHVHAVTKMVEEVPATCTQTGVKEHGNCDKCGVLVVKDGDKLVAATEADLVIEKIPHVFKNKIVSDEYLVSEATADTPQTFAKACACGLKSESESDRYTTGKTLNEYAAEDKENYRPVSPVLSLYDAANCVYGFSWNTAKTPARPVLEIKQPGDAEYKKVRARYESMSSYEYAETGDKIISRSYIKVEAQLTPDTTYEYRVGDAYLDVYTEPVAIKAVNPSENGKWSFAHVSDSQTLGNDGSGSNSGNAFSNTLKGISKDENNRFIVHTGDVVEWSRYESYWTNMLDYNFGALSVMPVMAISGNHEVSYRNGTSETYKHFNYKYTAQTVKNGLYYSFAYGGVKFVMINTNELNNYGGLRDHQYNWIINELKNNTEKWLVVGMHNPMYSVGKWGSDESRNLISQKLTEQLGDAFAKYGVDLVLQGHDHMISKTVPIGEGGVAATETFEEINGVQYSVNPKGTIYVMNGPAGNQAKDDSAIFPHDESLYTYAEKSYISSWADITVDGNTLTVNVRYMQNGSIVNLKTWGVKKV